MLATDLISLLMYGSATAKKRKSIGIFDAQKGMLKACDEVLGKHVDPFLCAVHRVEHVRISSLIPVKFLTLFE